MRVDHGGTMWRIHLTAGDLARVRIASSPNPGLELLLSVRIAASMAGEAEFGRWRRRCRRRHGADLRGLTALAAGLQSDEMWLGDRHLHGYFADAVQPYWPSIRRCVHEELARCRAVLAGGGVDGLMSMLSAHVCWESPDLIVPGRSTTLELRLAGGGLVVQPCFFAYDDVSVRRHSDGSAVLSYPVDPELGWFNSVVDLTDHRLGDVLGATRARMLEILAEGAATTTELSGHLGLSLASASQQAGRLRRAGLVTSTPAGKCVVHRATSIGVELLSAVGWAARSHHA